MQSKKRCIRNRQVSCSTVDIISSKRCGYTVNCQMNISSSSQFSTFLYCSLLFVWPLQQSSKLSQTTFSFIFLFSILFNVAHGVVHSIIILSPYTPWHKKNIKTHHIVSYLCTKLSLKVYSRLNLDRYLSISISW